MKKPRRNLQRPRLAAPHVLAALRRFFAREAVTSYAAAREMLSKRFGIQVSQTTILNTWHRLYPRKRKECPTRLKSVHAAALRRWWQRDARMPYREAQERLAREFRLRVSISCLWSFWQRAIAKGVDR